MIAQQNMNADERTVTVLWANTWASTFLVFGLLIGITYRSIVFHEGCWDLFALLGISGIIAIVYAARHKVRVLNRKGVIVMAVGALVAAVISAILAAMKAM
jgi:hypothetical protein